jgi:hypothetical protein
MLGQSLLIANHAEYANGMVFFRVVGVVPRSCGFYGGTVLEFPYFSGTTGPQTGETAKEHQ